MLTYRYKTSPQIRSEHSQQNTTGYPPVLLMQLQNAPLLCQNDNKKHSYDATQIDKLKIDARWTSMMKLITKRTSQKFLCKAIKQTLFDRVSHDRKPEDP